MSPINDPTFQQILDAKVLGLACIKFGYSEKATKFEKIFHLEFDATQ